MTYPITLVSAVPRLTGLIAAVFVLAAGCTAAGPATQPVQRASAWGPEVNGLRARFIAPAEIEQNAPLAVAFEVQCDARSVPAGMSGFDSHSVDTHLRLTLTNVATGQPFEIGPYEYRGPLLVGEDASPLDGKPMKPIATKFPLRAAGQGLKPGVYDCVVSYSLKTGERGRFLKADPEQLWHGELRAAPMRLTVKPEVLRAVTFPVPKSLRLTRDRKVVFLPEDAERITADLGNGMFIGARIICRAESREMHEEVGGPPPQPGGANPIDDWDLKLKSHPPGGMAEYTIEVFAMADWQDVRFAGPGVDDYKTLWKKQFVLRDETPRK